MTDGKEKRRKRDIFVSVALWQFIVFIMLICLVWASEVLNLPALYFGGTEQPLDIFRPFVLSAGVIVCAIITVGNTYMQQRHVIKGMLMVCSSCQKIRIKQDVWEGMDYYLSKHSMVVLSHGFCPDCYNKLVQSMDKK